MRAMQILLTVLTGCVLGSHMLEMGSLITKESCQFDTFNVSCGDEAVIKMETAVYGRTKVGGCVLKSYDALGCTVDLLNHMDSLCSGRHQCEVEVPDKTMRNRNACPADLASHLDSSYGCVPVTTASGDACYSAGKLDINEPEGYLSSAVTQETGLGSSDCPWVIHALPDQKIRVTLLDFFASRNSKLGPNEVQKTQSSSCHTYAVITERRHITRESTVCGEGERERVVYLSATNEVNVRMSKYMSKHKAPYFLLKYQAIGCAKLTAPVNGWLLQQDREATVGCNNTKGRRHLHCDGNRWVGTLPNCTSPKGSVSGESESDGQTQTGSSETVWTILGEDWRSPLGILIVSALGVMLGLVIGVAMLSVVLIFMKRKRRCCSGEPDYEETVQDSDDHTAGYVIDNKTTAQSTILVDQMELVNLNDGNTYGAMWRSRPPSYSPPTESSLDTQTTRVGYTPSSSLRSDSLSIQPNIGGRIAELHTYESPTCPRRETRVVLPANLADREPS